MGSTADKNLQVIVEISDVIILVSRYPECLHIAQAAARPDCEELARVVVFVPGTAVLLPNRGLDKVLDMRVEYVRHVLSRSYRSNVLNLHLIDHLDSVIGHCKDGSEGGATHDWPRRPTEKDIIRKVWDRSAEIALWSTTKLFFQICPVLANDGVMGMVGNIESGRANDGVGFSFDAIFTDDSTFCDSLNTCEMDVHVGLLCSLHIRISRRDVSAANRPSGCEAFKKPLVFDVFGHARGEECSDVSLEEARDENDQYARFR